jgi:predicted kinase
MTTPVLARGRGGCLIIVCGLPGSGKTTTARQLARERPGVRLGPDEWMTALGANLWDSNLRERVELLQWSVAEDLLRIGATVIVEWGTWGRHERDALRVRARELGAAVELRYLDVPPDELWARIQARGMEDPPINRSDLDGWFQIFQAPDEGELRQYNPPAG